MKMSQEGSRHSVLVCLFVSLFVCLREVVDMVSLFVYLREAIDMVSWFVCLCVSGRR